MDHYLAEIELVEFWRKTRERTERASMLARAANEDAETDMLTQSQTPAPAQGRCRRWVAELLNVAFQKIRCHATGHGGDPLRGTR